MNTELNDEKIDRSSPIPLYHQLKVILKEFISHQSPDTLLPSEPELAQHFEISRPTVRQAIAELVNDGLVYKTHGKGTFVKAKRLRRDFGDWRGSLTEEISHLGMTTTTEVLECTTITSDDRLAEKFDIVCGIRFLHIKRIRSVSGYPILIVHSYLPFDLIPDFHDKDLKDRSLHELLETKYKLTIKKTRRLLEAVPAEGEVASYLNIPAGSPLQYFRNTVILDTGDVIEYSEGWYRGDAVSFTFEYEKRYHHSHR
ncbi:MAG: GntR family transcriptional regulator [Sphaerochaetaceae bacterium]|nr:GntR family transcriptional regulator [Sphaerochaetaceae bacterium]